MQENFRTSKLLLKIKKTVFVSLETSINVCMCVCVRATGGGGIKSVPPCRNIFGVRSLLIALWVFKSAGYECAPPKAIAPDLKPVLNISII